MWQKYKNRLKQKKSCSFDYDFPISVWNSLMGNRKFDGVDGVLGDA